MDTQTLLNQVSADEIRRASSGEVSVSEFINYRTFRPVRRGLFCENIFGSNRGGICKCGQYDRHGVTGLICSRCGVSIVARKVSEEPIGHIELGRPVTVPSIGVVECIAVISPALRPIVKFADQRAFVHDLNFLYRRLIDRNNRLKKMLPLSGTVAVDDVIAHEMSLLQESIEHVFDNSHCASPETDRNGRPYISLLDLFGLLSRDLVESLTSCERQNDAQLDRDREQALVRRLRRMTSEEKERWLARTVELYEADNGFVPPAKTVSMSWTTQREAIAQYKLMLGLLDLLLDDDLLDDDEEP